MAKATKQNKRIARRRPVGLTAAPLTGGSPELGAPRLGQINHLGVARHVHHLTAASLPGAAPVIGPAEDHAAPQSAAPVAPKLSSGAASKRIATALSKIFPNGLPSKDAEPDRTIKLKLIKYFKDLKHNCPVDKTIYRFLKAARSDQ